MDAEVLWEGRAMGFGEHEAQLAVADVEEEMLDKRATGKTRQNWAAPPLYLFSPDHDDDHGDDSATIALTSTMNSSSQSLELVFGFLAKSYTTLETNFYRIPGSAVVARYVRSSHQNDPGRTLLEVILVIFAIRTLLQSRTRGDQSGKHFIQFDEKVRIASPVLFALCAVTICLQEIDELVEEWTPEPLAQPLSAQEQADLAAVPVIVGPTGPKPKLASGKTVLNLASYNFTGLAGNEEIKAACVETLRKYGLGSCGPPGFYGFQGEPRVQSLLRWRIANPHSRSVRSLVFACC